MSIIKICKKDLLQLIVLIIAALVGAFYLGKTYNKPTSAPSQQTSQPSPLSSETSMKKEDKKINGQSIEFDQILSTFKFQK